MPDTEDGLPVRRPGARPPVGTTSLAHVARTAGVSEATVSRVLNHRSGVAPATRAAVEEALRSLDYERPVTSGIVLLVTPNLRNPIFAAQAEHVETALSPHGLTTIICPVYPGTPRERDYVQALMDAGVAAIVFLSSSNTLRHGDHGVVELVERRGIPYVCINGGFPGSVAPVVSTDDHRAAELAVGHLVDLGHRRIGLIAGPTDNTPADRRVEGFDAAMARRGLPATDVVRQDFNVRGGVRAATTLLERGVTGVVASSDEMALGAILAARRDGLRVPEDVSVIGYDDSDLLDHTAPPLTTVRQPVERIAEQVARLVLDRVAGREVGGDEVLVEPVLHLRASTAPA